MTKTSSRQQDKNTVSQRQREIVEFIRGFRRAEGRPPTVREIQKALGISSTSVVDYNIKQLVEKDVLRRSPGISRGVDLAEPDVAESFAVPILGQIAAGQPIEVPESISDPANWDEVINLNPAMIDTRADNLFALRVKGYSMVDALIADGDIVIMKPQNTAENGETVAVWIEPERTTTLKRFYHEGDVVRLQPANVTMDPIYVAPEDIQIQGKLVGVLRFIQH